MTADKAVIEKSGHEKRVLELEAEIKRQQESAQVAIEQTKKLAKGSEKKVSELSKESKSLNSKLATREKRIEELEAKLAKSEEETEQVQAALSQELVQRGEKLVELYGQRDKLSQALTATKEALQQREAQLSEAPSEEPANGEEV